MSHNFVHMILLTLSIFLLSAQSVFGSGGSLVSVGPLLGGPSGDTGLRELVILEKKGDFLVGRPSYSAIKLITVYAPGAEENHLILREIDTPEGEKTFLLTATNSLQEKISRITLFVKPDSIYPSLWEYKDETWIPKQPQLIKVVGIKDNNNTEQRLYAYSVNNLGLFWATNGKSLSVLNNSVTPLDISAKGLLGGYIGYGLLPWASAFVVLILGWTISRWSYRKEIR